MNDYDRENFNFMMSLGEQEFEDFFADMPDDDVQYAIELIRLARSEMMVQEHELIDALADSDLDEARAVLKQFML